VEASTCRALHKRECARTCLAITIEVTAPDGFTLSREFWAGRWKGNLE
jgi:hypothetical protein